MKKVKKKVRDLNVGDLLVGARGEPVEVTHLFPIETPNKMYRITLEDGSTVDCSGDHLWYAETTEDRSEAKVKSLKDFLNNYELAEVLRDGEGCGTIEEIGDYLGDDENERICITHIMKGLGHVIEVNFQDPKQDKTGLSHYEKYADDHGIVRLYDLHAVIKRIYDLKEQNAKGEDIMLGQVYTTQDLLDKIQEGQEIFLLKHLDTANAEEE